MKKEYDKYNFTKEERKVLEDIMRYKNQIFEECRFGNPNITKRDTIYLANAIQKIISYEGE